MKKLIFIFISISLIFGAMPVCFVPQLFAQTQATPLGYSISTGSDQLFQIDLETGTAQLVGDVPFGNVQGLAFDPSSGELYGYDNLSEVFFIIDPSTAEITWQGQFDAIPPPVGSATIGFNPEGNLRAFRGGNLFNVNTTGTTTNLGKLEPVPEGKDVVSLAGIQSVGGSMFVIRVDYIDANNSVFNLGILDEDLLFVSDIGPFQFDRIPFKSTAGLSANSIGQLWAIIDNPYGPSSIVTVDSQTGRATWIADISCVPSTVLCFGFRSLAIAVPPAPEPTITITSPNGGEELSAGTTHEITRTSEGDIENVKIEYSVNNGADWIQIVESTQNDGSHNWEVPCDLSDESLVRISNMESETFDTSDEVFPLIDDIAPNIDVSATPDILWPPNHKMVPVTATVIVTDNCDTEPAIEFVSIVMNENDETITYDPNYDFSVNDGQTSGDIQIVDDWNFYLRCERSGKSDGRTYTITYRAIDCSGNESIADAEVLVPHNI